MLQPCDATSILTAQLGTDTYAAVATAGFACGRIQLRRLQFVCQELRFALVDPS